MGRFFFRGPGMVKGEASIRSGSQTAVPKKAGRRNFAAFDKLGDGSGHRLDGKDVTKARIKYLSAKSARLARKGLELSAKEKAELGTFHKHAGSYTASELRAQQYQKRINAERAARGLSPIPYDEGPAAAQYSDVDDSDTGEFYSDQMESDEIESDIDEIEVGVKVEEDDAPQKRRPVPVNPYKKQAIAERQKIKRIEKKKQDQLDKKKKDKTAPKRKRMTTEVSSDDESDGGDRPPTKGKAKAKAKISASSRVKKPAVSKKAVVSKTKTKTAVEETLFDSDGEEQRKEWWEELSDDQDDQGDDYPTWVADNDDDNHEDDAPVREDTPNHEKASTLRKRVLDSDESEVDQDNDNDAHFRPNGLLQLPPPPKRANNVAPSASRSSHAAQSSSQEIVELTSSDDDDDMPTVTEAGRRTSSTATSDPKPASVSPFSANKTSAATSSTVAKSSTKQPARPRARSPIELGPAQKSAKAPLKRGGGAGPYQLGSTPSASSAAAPRASSSSSAAERKRSLALREMTDRLAENKARDAKGQALGGKPSQRGERSASAVSGPSKPSLAGPSQSRSSGPRSSPSRLAPAPSKSLAPPKEYTSPFRSSSSASGSSFSGPRTPTSLHGPVPTGPKEWSCPTCTLDNPAFVLDCDACGTLRSAAREMYADGWSCRACAVVNEEVMWSCRGCGEVKRQGQ